MTNFKISLINLYYLLVHADGSVGNREELVGQQMIQIEGIKEGDFEVELNLARKKDSQLLTRQTITMLKGLAQRDQVRIIAWLCILANADGFMDRREWQFIYKLYHKELNLPLESIMKVQGELLQATQHVRSRNNFQAA